MDVTEPSVNLPRASANVFDAWVNFPGTTAIVSDTSAHGSRTPGMDHET